MWSAWVANALAAPIPVASLGVVAVGGGSYASSWEGVSYGESVIVRGYVPNVELAGGVRWPLGAVRVGGDAVACTHLENLYDGPQPGVSLQAVAEVGGGWRAGVSAGYALGLLVGPFHGPMGGVDVSGALGPALRLGGRLEGYHLAAGDESTTGARALVRLTFGR